MTGTEVGGGGKDLIHSPDFVGEVVLHEVLNHVTANKTHSTKD